MMIFIRVRLLGEAITIDEATLLANDFDPDGDHSALHITSVTLLSGDGEFVDNVMVRGR